MTDVRLIYVLSVAAAGGVGAIVAGTVGALVVGGFFAASLWLAWRFGDRLLLRWLRAWPLGASLREQRIAALVDDLARELGIPKPELWRCDSAQINAFAIDWRGRPILCVTQGLLQEGSRAHVRALLAAQLARIAGPAAARASVGAVLAGIGSMVARLGVSPRVEREPNPFAMPLALLLTPVLARLARIPVRADFEREALRRAAALVGDNEVLRRALERAELIAHVEPMSAPAALTYLGAVPHLGAPPLSLARAYSSGWPVAERLRWLSDVTEPDVTVGRPVPEAA